MGDLVGDGIPDLFAEACMGCWGAGGVVAATGPDDGITPFENGFCGVTWAFDAALPVERVLCID